MTTWQGVARKLLCKLLGWHNGIGGPVTFDGASFCGTCSRCGARVLRDSQGNWFEVGRYR